MIGAVAHMAFENLVNVDMEVTRLNKTISEFEEAEVEIKILGKKCIISEDIRNNCAKA